MITRRLVVASSLATAFLPSLARGETNEFTLRGTMEQGSLIVGQVTGNVQVTFDGEPLHLTDGMFACGLDWDRTKVAQIAIHYDGGSVVTRDVMPIVRQYNVQHVNGLPPRTVNPATADLDRIHDEHARLAAARKADSDHIWFADPFDWPAPGIMSGVFGSQRIDNGKPMTPHMGVDMANVEGTPIRSPANATVALTDDFFLEGGFTLLDHGHGVFTHYMHQSLRLVKPGDAVTRGQIIGHIGKTGRATGPHLHWGMNWFQVKLDPSRSTRTPAPPRA